MPTGPPSWAPRHSLRRSNPQGHRVEPVFVIVVKKYTKQIYLREGFYPTLIFFCLILWLDVDSKVVSGIWSREFDQHPAMTPPIGVYWGLINHQQPPKLIDLSLASAPTWRPDSSLQANPPGFAVKPLGTLQGTVELWGSNHSKPLKLALCTDLGGWRSSYFQ